MKVLYLNQSRRDSSDSTWETIGTQAESRNAHAQLLMLWVRQISQGSIGHHPPGIFAVGAHTLG